MAKSLGSKKPTALRPAQEQVPAVVQTRGELIDAAEFALISEPASLEALRYNLSEEKISEFDLDRVKVPTGGGTVFQVPTLEGIENAEAVEGIILHVGVRRSYWESLTIGGSTPPDCYSLDGMHGIGNPGGDCSTCPLNEFGSAVRQDGSQGRGKRCKERRLVLMLRPEDRLPLSVLAPPASIKNIKQFLMRLPVPMFQAIVRLSLVPDRNTDGILYSKLVPEYVGYISKEHGEELLKYSETLKKSIVAQAPRASDVVEGSVVNPQGGAEDLPD